MPRYIDLIVTKFYDKVDEVRIEGHTSSEYGSSSELEAFTRNMELSQDRTRAVLEYSLNISDLEYRRPWMYKNVSANGLSSARLILQKDGKENKTLSRRVDFQNTYKGPKRRCSALYRRLRLMWKKAFE